MGYFCVTKALYIHWLTTQDGISKATGRTFKYLELLFSADRNYHALRKRVAEARPRVTYLGIVSKDLFMIEDGNESIVKESHRQMQTLPLVNVPISTLKFFDSN